MRTPIASRTLFMLFAAVLVSCGGNPVEQIADSPTQAEPTAAEAAEPWTVVFKTEPVKFKASVAGFLNESIGITAGYGGEIHYTSDGGGTWPNGVNESMCRYGLDILDEKTAWTIGNGGNVRMSNDGGRTWQAAASVPIGFSQFISMADSKIGWAANYDRLVATEDGAQTWTAVDLPDGIRGIAAVQRRTAEAGYLVDKSGTLFATADGGKTWTAIPLGLDKAIFTPAKIPMGAVRFTDSDHGVVIASLEDSGGELTALWTADGGTTWRSETLPEKMGVLFLSRDTIYLTVFSTDNRIALLRHDAAAP